MRKSRFLAVTLAVISAGVLSLPLMSCSSEVSFTTAKLSEVTMARSIDSSTFKPVQATDTFSIDTPEIFLSAKFSNAPAETEITAEWIYVEGEVEGMTDFLIDTVSVEVSGTDYLYFSMPMPDTGWPRGQYAVKLYIDGKAAETATFAVQ
jgi:hypothetical protein